MLTTSDYLNKCKVTLGLENDYQLAKEWSLDTSSMSQYQKGKLKPDTYLCFRIAETLHESPTKIIAELESQNQRNEVKSLYFKRFFSIVGLWITLGLMLPSLGTFSNNVYAAGTRADSDISAHYTK